MQPLRPYAPNVRPPEGYRIAQGQARLLERIWQPTYRWLHASSYGVGSAAMAIRAGELLAKNRPTYVENTPDADNEVIMYQDDLHRAVVALAAPPGVVYEVARLVCVQQGAAIIERIGTWARITAKDGAGAAIWTTELREPDDSTNALGGFSDTFASPFPFPMAHPTTGSRLQIRWSLRVQDISYQDNNAMPLLAAATPQAIPVGTRYPHLPGDWNDMRYLWGSRDGANHQWVVGSYALIRLFATISGVAADWDVAVAGRLTGFTQNAGHKGAALANVCRR